MYLKYFPTGRLFVHEWAHLRWGVFDEYNDDEPFYSANTKKIEATRHDYLNCLKLLQAVTSHFPLTDFFQKPFFHFCPNAGNRYDITKQCFLVF